MKHAYAIAIIACLVAPHAFAAPGPDDIKTVFTDSCGVCHDTGENGAPMTDDMKKLEPAAVVEKLTTGTMAGMAGGLTDQQKREIAAFVTGKSLPPK